MSFAEKNFPEYKLNKRKVVVNHCEYNAHYVKNHSTISAIIYEWRNTRDGDGWSNIPNYQLNFYVKYKNSKKCKLICQNEFFEKNYGTRNSGLFEILFNLEKSEFRENYNKKIRKQFLKSKISEYTKELETLE
jgi:hypothetical protein